MFYSEKEAKDFLEKEGFDILESKYFQDKLEIKQKIAELRFPLAVKVFGKNIVHKNKLGGVKLGIKSYEEVLENFDKMKTIKGFQGITIQEQIIGKEIFLGLKKTPEFGHTIAFGSGGTNVEKEKDIIFRICPIRFQDADAMIKETKIFSRLNQKEILSVKKNILKLNELSKKYQKILELDINPLIVIDDFAKIIDARILWE